MPAGDQKHTMLINFQSSVCKFLERMFAERHDTFPVHLSFLRPSISVQFYSNQLYTYHCCGHQIAEIAANPWAEVCWYFPNSREQYRLGGSLTIVDETCEDEVLAKVRARQMHPVHVQALFCSQSIFLQSIIALRHHPVAAQQEPQAQACNRWNAVSTVTHSHADGTLTY